MERGRLDLCSVNVEPDKCFFHADDSGRVLHLGADQVRYQTVGTACLMTTSAVTSYNTLSNASLRRGVLLFIPHQLGQNWQTWYMYLKIIMYIYVIMNSCLILYNNYVYLCCDEFLCVLIAQKLSIKELCVQNNHCCVIYTWQALAVENFQGAICVEDKSVGSPTG